MGRLQALRYLVGLIFKVYPDCPRCGHSQTALRRPTAALLYLRNRLSWTCFASMDWTR